MVRVESSQPGKSQLSRALVGTEGDGDGLDDAWVSDPAANTVYGFGGRGGR